MTNIKDLSHLYSATVLGLAHLAHTPSICVLTQPGAPFTTARVFGRLPDDTLPPSARKSPGDGSVGEEVRQMFKNLQEILSTIGADMSHLGHVTVLCTPGFDKSILDGVWREFYPERSPCPTRNVDEVPKLADGCRIALLCSGVVPYKTLTVHFDTSPSR